MFTSRFLLSAAITSLFAFIGASQADCIKPRVEDSDVANRTRLRGSALVNAIGTAEFENEYRSIDKASSGANVEVKWLTFNYTICMFIASDPSISGARKAQLYSELIAYSQKPPPTHPNPNSLRPGRTANIYLGKRTRFSGGSSDSFIVGMTLNCRASSCADPGCDYELGPGIVALDTSNRIGNAGNRYNLNIGEQQAIRVQMANGAWEDGYIKILGGVPLATPPGSHCKAQPSENFLILEGS